VEFVLIALGLLVFTAFAGVMIETILRRRDRAARKGGNYLYPECANCGYNVHGLPGSRCPECGSQLRAVGLVWKRD
jgi:predicted Zn-ribbon and HTH transcriptional regulator